MDADGSGLLEGGERLSGHGVPMEPWRRGSPNICLVRLARYLRSFKHIILKNKTSKKQKCSSTVFGQRLHVLSLRLSLALEVTNNMV